MIDIYGASLNWTTVQAFQLNNSHDNRDMYCKKNYLYRDRGPPGPVAQVAQNREVHIYVMII
jgi:hypothetical protein